MNGYLWTVKLAMRWYPHQIERRYQQISHPQHCSTSNCGPEIIRTKVKLFKFKCPRTRGVHVMADIMAAKN